MTGMFIFVCDRGHVIMGNAESSKDMAFAFHLTKSVTIRNWGTTKGLAELINGPTTSTKLDAVCERTLPLRSIIDIIHLTDKGIVQWGKALVSE